jgi:hypothetical protein
MFKKIEPKKDRVIHQIDQFPHCDQRILHAPGECEYCDMHPDWQALRIHWGIAFTGYEPEGTELPCPANHARGNNVNLWGGNIARSKDSQPDPLEEDENHQDDDHLYEPKA